MHVLLSSLPVSVFRLKSGTDIRANTLLTFPIAGLNLFVVFIPLAWVSYFCKWEHVITFTCMLQLFAFLLHSQDILPVCFLGIVSLEKMFDWGGEQLAMYCGPDLGDLIIITLNKYVYFISPNYTTLTPHSQRRRSYPCGHSSFPMRVCINIICCML